MYGKSKIGLRVQNFSVVKNFFQNFDFIQTSKNEIEDNNKKICSQFILIVSYKFDFTAFDRHRDHPPALVLNFTFNILKLMIGIMQSIPGPTLTILSRHVCEDPTVVGWIFTGRKQ